MKDMVLKMNEMKEMNEINEMEEQKVMEVIEKDIDSFSELVRATNTVIELVQATNTVIEFINELIKVIIENNFNKKEETDKEIN